MTGVRFEGLGCLKKHYSVWEHCSVVVWWSNVTELEQTFFHSASLMSPHCRKTAPPSQRHSESEPGAK